MLKFENRYDSYAYRIASKPLADPTAYLEEGQWVTLNDSGQIVKSDGTKKSFPCLTSKRPGRDNVSTQVNARASYLHGTFELTLVNNPDATEDTVFDSAKSYAAMTPLKVDSEGRVAPWVAPVVTEAGAMTPKNDFGIEIVAYALGAPEGNTLRICSK